MKPRSLRANLILWFTFIFSLIIVISDTITYNALRRILIAETDTSLLSMATIESVAFKEGNALDIETIDRQAEQYPRYIPQFGQVLDAQGAVVNQFGLLATTGAVLNPTEIAAALGGKVIATDSVVEGNPVRLAAVNSVRNGVAFAVVIGTTTGNANHTISQVAVILLVIDIIAIAASIGGGYLIIAKALKPIDHIAERAHQIGEGNLRQRLEYMDSSSEMVRLTSVLNEMLDKLQRLFESQKQFVQDASHETRSPLAALRCRLEVALRQPRPAEDYRQVIEASLQDTTRLTTLANDLFLLARADSNNLAMELREVSLAETAAAIYDQLLPVAESRGIDFLLAAEPGCMVYADRARLSQALRNLAENALKYTPKGGRVQIRVVQEGERMRLDIIDTGIGIPKAEQEKIFRRFYRVDHARARSDGGTGLGLAICDQIIRAHHGHLEVDSTPGRGTRFTLYLDAATSLLDQ